jgi:nucleoside-diphosphate-sugar epimerase
MIKRRILICGSEGSLMSHVLKFMVQQEDAEYYGVDTCERYGHRSKLGEELDDRYEHYNLDLCDSESTRVFINAIKPDMIIQGAAKIYGVGGFNRYKADILGDDIALHRNVLSAAVEAGTKRVVFTSSSMVYESIKDHVPVHEGMTFTSDYAVPQTDYGLSKLTNERLSLAYAEQYGLDYTIFRPFNILTPFEKATDTMGDSHVFADFIKKLVFENSKVLPVYGDGKQVRCFTWIDDIAEMIATCITGDKQEQSKNKIFNLGSEEPVNMLDLAQLIHKIAYERNRRSQHEMLIDFRPGFKNDVRYRVPDCRWAGSQLGWKTTKSLEEMITFAVETVNKRYITDSRIRPVENILIGEKEV